MFCQITFNVKNFIYFIALIIQLVQAPKYAGARLERSYKTAHRFAYNLNSIEWNKTWQQILNCNNEFNNRMYDLRNELKTVSSLDELLDLCKNNIEYVLYVHHKTSRYYDNNYPYTLYLNKLIEKKIVKEIDPHIAQSSQCLDLVGKFVIQLSKSNQIKVLIGELTRLKLVLPQTFRTYFSGLFNSIDTENLKSFPAGNILRNLLFNSDDCIIDLYITLANTIPNQLSHFVLNQKNASTLTTTMVEGIGCAFVEKFYPPFRGVISSDMIQLIFDIPEAFTKISLPDKPQYNKFAHFVEQNKAKFLELYQNKPEIFLQFYNNIEAPLNKQAMEKIRMAARAKISRHRRPITGEWKRGLKPKSSVRRRQTH